MTIRKGKTRMQRRFSNGVKFLLGMILAVSLTTSVQGQDKEKKVPGPKQDRVNAVVRSVDKATSSFIVRRGTQDMTVVYDSRSTITYKNKPSTADEIKEGRRVICLGSMNAKKQLEASQIDIREGEKEGK
jgi:hypothetical protein